MIALIFALIDMPPSNGSTLLANTGTGKPVFDCTGSNNIIFRDLNILAIGRPNPSTIGIIFGTSYTAPTPGWPGGSNCAMENVSISLTNAAGSTPMAFIGGSGPAHFFNVWTVGQYGLLFSTNNNTGIASPYVEFGEKLTIDAVVGVGCSLQSWGMHNTLYIEGCDNHTWAQTYMALLDETGTWAGNPYPILLSNVIDIRIDVESDYWPSLFTAYGNIDSVTIRGTVWQSTTPIPANVPVVGLFNGGGSVTNSTFSVKGVIHSLPNHNFYYTTVGGSSPTLNGFNACVFDQYDTTVSPNVFYGDCNSTYSVPFFNVQFSGNFDVAIGTSGPIAFLVNGGGATAAQYRCFVNGIRQGTA
jgi:hypothetical protein